MDENGDVTSARDHYPYGMLMPGRIFEPDVEGKRYQFTGHEFDNEVNYGYHGARYYNRALGRYMSLDPLAAEYPSLSDYCYVAGNPIMLIDPTGMAVEDWVEGANGDITWRKDVNENNYNDILKDGEIYRGTSYSREKIWSNVNVRGNIENGLMFERYKPDGKMSYKNLTPWVDVGFEEMAKEISETGSNPEIIKYWEYTQIPGAAADGDKWAQSVLTEDQTPWCAGFVNYCLETSGVEGTNYATAFSFTKYGQDLGNDKPVYGAIAVMGYSHVGFVVGTNEDGRIILLGGNQGDAVNLSPNGTSAVRRYVYPNGYVPPKQTTPQYNLIGRSLTNATSR